jgi:hypothetical protein
MRRLLVLILAAAAAAGAAEPAHVDQALGAAFPVRLAGFIFEKLDRHEGPGQGYSLCYRGAEGEVADVFVYDLGIAGIGSGAADPQAQVAQQRAIADLDEARRMGLYLSVTEDPACSAALAAATGGHWRCTGLVMVFDPKYVDTEMGTVRSALLVTAQRGRFIAIRCSHPLTREDGEAGTIAFANALAGLLALP